MTAGGYYYSEDGYQLYHRDSYCWISAQRETCRAMAYLTGHADGGYLLPPLECFTNTTANRILVRGNQAMLNGNP